MVEFIIKYWVQCLLGVIATGVSFLAKKFYNLYQAEKNHQRTKEQEAFCQEILDTIQAVGEESRKGDKALQEQIIALKSGVLSLQGRTFKEECRKLLKEDHTITLDEYESLISEHNTYKGLGGNHDGDALFEMAKQKAKSDIAQQKIREP